MREDQSENTVQLVHQAVQARRHTEAQRMADVLIRNHLDPDQRVVNLQSFSSALVAALEAARIRGEDDAGDVLTLT
jgi:hypothetical protein